MFRKVEDFRSALDTLSEGTRKIFAKLTDDNLGQPVAPGHRTLGQIAWHIVVTIPEMMNQVGLSVTPIPADTPPPASAEKIREIYDRSVNEFRREITENWQDSDLQIQDNLYGEIWTRGLTLQILLHHEIHHRGQMTVLLRQAGAGVPGNFGPSKEEWKEYGSEPPAY